MKLDRVTISGADDMIRPETLCSISEQFPFVEWGILFSTSLQGQPRYPSDAWLRELYRFRKELKLSAHLCGRYAREFLFDKSSFFDLYEPDMFGRIQINGFSLFRPNPTHVAQNIRDQWRQDFILQSHDDDSFYRAAVIAREVNLRERVSNRVCILNDASGGRGESPQGWSVPCSDIRCGYAGGLGPDNVREEVIKIATPFESFDYLWFWIDMESKVRSDNQFDLTKVNAVLTQIQDIMD